MMYHIKHYKANNISHACAQEIYENINPEWK